MVLLKCMQQRNVIYLNAQEALHDEDIDLVIFYVEFLYFYCFTRNCFHYHVSSQQIVIQYFQNKTENLTAPNQFNDKKQRLCIPKMRITH